MLAMLNLAGFGMIAWDDASHEPDIPWRYHSTGLPVFDHNLRALSTKIACRNLLAHIRGVPLDGSATVNEQNLHPFHFPGSQLAMAHNGDLYQFASMRYDLVTHIRPQMLSLIRGNTDSEWIYALLMSQFSDYTAQHSSEEISTALQQTLTTIRAVRKQHHIEISSSMNLFISSPDCLIATRFAFDYGCYPLPENDEVHQGCVDYLSLWFTRGSDFAQHDGEWKMIGGKESAESIIVASEPLSVDTSTWIEVPEYHLLAVNKKPAGIETKLIPLH